MQPEKKVTSDLTGNGKKIAKKGVLIQVMVAFIMVAVSTAAGNTHLAMSLAAGAVISIIPGIAFAGFAFRYSGARQNQLVARSFSQGAKVKLALTILLFVLAFAVLKAAPLAVFIAYAITTVSYWLALFRYS